MNKALLDKLKALGIKVEALSEDALALVAAVAQAVVEPVQTALTEAQTQLKAAVEKNTALETQVAGLAKTGTPAADPKAADKGKGKEADADQAPAWALKLTERLDAIENNVTTKDKATAASTALDTVLKAKFPNLKVTDRMRGRYLAAGLTDAAKIEAEIRADIEDLTARGVKVETLSADPTAEGAKPTDTKVGTDAAKEADAIKKIRATGGAGKN